MSALPSFHLSHHPQISHELEFSCKSVLLKYGKRCKTFVKPILGETVNFNFWNVYADYAHKQYAYKINLVQQFQYWVFEKNYGKFSHFLYGKAALLYLIKARKITTCFSNCKPKCLHTSPGLLSNPVLTVAIKMFTGQQNQTLHDYVA